MKFSKGVRGVFLRMCGFKQTPAIDAAGFKALAEKESVLVLGMHGLDPQLPGQQLRGSLTGLSEIVREIPKDRAIVAHCA